MKEAQGYQGADKEGGGACPALWPPQRRKKCGAWRRGQTAVEYLLITVALTIAFASIYRVLQWYLTKQFRQGGIVILRMYKELPW